MTPRDMPAYGAARPGEGWELETARWVVERARQELMRLEGANDDWPSLAQARYRYGSALRRLQRIQGLLRGSAVRSDAE